LFSPGNNQLLLHQRGGGSNDNIIKAFNRINTPALAQFLGESATGTWSLKVSDHANADEGKLNRWALRLKLSS